MTQKDKRIAILIAVALIVLTIGAWLMPRETAYAYEGEGETYTSEQKEGEEEEQQLNQEQDGAIKNSIDNTADETISAMDDIQSAVNEIFNSESYDEARDEYETPEYVYRFEKSADKASIAVSDIATRVFAAISGLVVIHGLLGIMFTAYYDYWKDKKYNFFLRSVTVTREKFNGTEKSVSTTTTNPDGSITQNVANVAKKATGPLSTYLYFFVNVVIEIAVAIIIFLLIKNGYVKVALQAVIELFTNIVTTAINAFKGI